MGCGQIKACVGDCSVSDVPDALQPQWQLPLCLPFVGLSGFPDHYTDVANLGRHG